MPGKTPTDQPAWLTTAGAAAPGAPLDMDPGIRDRWAAALRSGKYPQGRSVLRTREGKFCCLGVLCELAAAAGVIPPAALYRGEWLYDSDYDTELPVRVRNWAGLMSGNPVPPSAPDGLSLAALNDGHEAHPGDRGDEDRAPWAFDQIAGVIDGAA
jgi:hypothetical protein